jgi:hypothetical protein
MEGERIARGNGGALRGRNAEGSQEKEGVATVPSRSAVPEKKREWRFGGDEADMWAQLAESEGKGGGLATRAGLLGRFPTRVGPVAGFFSSSGSFSFSIL